MPLPIHEPLMDRHILLLGNLVSFCGEAADVFCISMVNLPPCTQDNNKGSQRPAELRAHILNRAIVHLAELHNMCSSRQPLSGLLRLAKIGLASKRDDTWNDKTPVYVCQAWSLSD